MLCDEDGDTPGGTSGEHLSAHTGFEWSSFDHGGTHEGRDVDSQWVQAMVSERLSEVCMWLDAAVDSHGRLIEPALWALHGLLPRILPSCRYHDCAADLLPALQKLHGALLDTFVDPRALDTFDSPSLAKTLLLQMIVLLSPVRQPSGLCLLDGSPPAALHTAFDLCLGLVLDRHDHDDGAGACEPTRDYYALVGSACELLVAMLLHTPEDSPVQEDFFHCSFTRLLRSLVDHITDAMQFQSRVRTSAAFTFSFGTQSDARGAAAADEPLFLKRRVSDDARERPPLRDVVQPLLLVHLLLNEFALGGRGQRKEGRSDTCPDIVAEMTSLPHVVSPATSPHPRPGGRSLHADAAELGAAPTVSPIASPAQDPLPVPGQELVQASVSSLYNYLRQTPFAPQQETVAKSAVPAPRLPGHLQPLVEGLVAAVVQYKKERALGTVLLQPPVDAAAAQAPAPPDPGLDLQRGWSTDGPLPQLPGVLPGLPEQGVPEAQPAASAPLPASTPGASEHHLREGGSAERAAANRTGTPLSSTSYPHAAPPLRSGWSVSTSQVTLAYQVLVLMTQNADVARVCAESLEPLLFFLSADRLLHLRGALRGGGSVGRRSYTEAEGNLCLQWRFQSELIYNCVLLGRSEDGDCLSQRAALCVVSYAVTCLRVYRSTLGEHMQYELSRVLPAVHWLLASGEHTAEVAMSLFAFRGLLENMKNIGSLRVSRVVPPGEETGAGEPDVDPHTCTDRILELLVPLRVATKRCRMFLEGASGAADSVDGQPVPDGTVSQLPIVALLPYLSRIAAAAGTMTGYFGSATFPVDKLRGELMCIAGHERFTYAVAGCTPVLQGVLWSTLCEQLLAPAVEGGGSALLDFTSSLRMMLPARFHHGISEPAVQRVHRSW